MFAQPANCGCSCSVDRAAGKRQMMIGLPNGVIRQTMPGYDGEEEWARSELAESKYDSNISPILLVSNRSVPNALVCSRSVFKPCIFPDVVIFTEFPIGGAGADCEQPTPNVGKDEISPTCHLSTCVLRIGVSARVPLWRFPRLQRAKVACQSHYPV